MDQKVQLFSIGIVYKVKGLLVTKGESHETVHQQHLAMEHDAVVSTANILSLELDGSTSNVVSVNHFHCVLFSVERGEGVVHLDWTDLVGCHPVLVVLH